MGLFSNFVKPLSDLGHFWQQKVNNHIFRWNLFFIGFQIALLAWKFNNLPPKVPLYYSLPWGESQLSNTSSLFLLPTISIVTLFIDNLFAASFFKNQPLISNLLISTALIVSLFSAITLFQIVFLIS